MTPTDAGPGDRDNERGDWNDELRAMLAGQVRGFFRPAAQSNADDWLASLLTIVLDLVEDSFCLEVQTERRQMAVYIQGRKHVDGFELEVVSNEFLEVPLPSAAVNHILELGWAPPDADRPNFSRTAPRAEPAQDTAKFLTRTLREAFDVVTPCEFTLSPAAMAKQALRTVGGSFTILDDSVPEPGAHEPVASPVASVSAAVTEEDEPAAVGVRPLVPTRYPGTLRQLALSVARCPQVAAARQDVLHPCHGVVCLQEPDPDVWQVPEAWAGNLAAGRIVFVSSNPSISEAGDAQSGEIPEMYPTGSWDDAKVADFVINRFAGGWANAAGRFLRTDGTYSPKPVTFWSGTRNRATELFGRPADAAMDYVMTEVVHCKSKAQRGVAKAAPTCAALHLDRILAATTAPLVVILGAAARDLLIPAWSLPAKFGSKAVTGIDENASVAVRTLGGRPRVVTYLGHPAGMTGPKTFAGAYPYHLPELARLVAGDADIMEAFHSPPPIPPDQPRRHR